MSKLNKTSTISQWLDAEQSAAELRSRLAAVEQEATTLQPEVAQIIAAAAERWLVDAAGNPVDSGVYWFSHIALVRVNGTVKIIPVETMDEEKVFTFAADPGEEEVKE